MVTLHQSEKCSQGAFAEVLGQQSGQYTGALLRCPVRR